MSEKQKKVSVQKFFKIIWATVFLIILIMALWIILDCFRKTPDTEQFIMNYNATPNIDYKVYLKPNKFYEQKYLTKDKKYISSIIDYIDIDVNYKLNSSKSLDFNYTYKVDASIGSQYELNGVVAELWKKNYNLVPVKSTKQNTSSINLNDNIKIDYNKYDNLAKGFKQEYGIVADTFLSINVTITADAKIPNSSLEIKENNTINLKIPLNKAVTDISITGNAPVTKNITQTIKGHVKMNYVLLIPSIILALISAPICFISFYKLFKITNVSQYLLQQKRILKNYSDIIAEVTTKPDLVGAKIVEVKDFEDLINIEEELRVPILFYELQKEDESWFIITTGSQAYRYILKSSSHI